MNRLKKRMMSIFVAALFYGAGVRAMKKEVALQNQAPYSMESLKHAARHSAFYYGIIWCRRNQMDL